MGEARRKRQTSVRFIDPQLPNMVGIVVAASAAELQIEVMCGKNPDHMKAGSVSRKAVADYISCSKTFKNYIQCASGSVLGREVPSASGSGKAVESDATRTRAGGMVQVDAINLDVADQRSVDGVVRRVPADRVVAI